MKPRMTFGFSAGRSVSAYGAVKPSVIRDGPSDQGSQSVSGELARAFLKSESSWWAA